MVEHSSNPNALEAVTGQTSVSLHSGFQDNQGCTEKHLPENSNHHTTTTTTATTTTTT